MAQKTYLVTGSMGCLGAWTLYHLVKQGERAISFDVSQDRHRLDLLLSPAEQDHIQFIHGDLTDTAQVKDTIQTEGVTHIIHLGALQVPFCRANPVLGSAVNVTGTLNIFEGAKAAGIGHVVYASSIAVYGLAEEYPAGLIQHDAPLNPATLYGAYKQCNEQNARTYWRDDQLSTTALRPCVVYGAGRDQGLTSDPTKAMVAAATNQAYQLGFGGRTQFQWASDVAQQFISAADHPLEGAHVFNLGGALLDIPTVIQTIQEFVPEAQLTFSPQVLPFPQGYDDSELRRVVPHIYETPFHEGVRQTIELFRNLPKS